MLEKFLIRIWSNAVNGRQSAGIYLRGRKTLYNKRYNDRHKEGSDHINELYNAALVTAGVAGLSMVTKKAFGECLGAPVIKTEFWNCRQRRDGRLSEKQGLHSDQY